MIRCFKTGPPRVVSDVFSQCRVDRHGLTAHCARDPRVASRVQQVEPVLMLGNSRPTSAQSTPGWRRRSVTAATGSRSTFASRPGAANVATGSRSGASWIANLHPPRSATGPGSSPCTPTTSGRSGTWPRLTSSTATRRAERPNDPSGSPAQHGARAPWTGSEQLRRAVLGSIGTCTAVFPGPRAGLRISPALVGRSPAGPRRRRATRWPRTRWGAGRSTRRSW